MRVYASVILPTVTHQRPHRIVDGVCPCRVAIAGRGRRGGCCCSSRRGPCCSCGSRRGCGRGSRPGCRRGCRCGSRRRCCGCCSACCGCRCCPRRGRRCCSRRRYRGCCSARCGCCCCPRRGRRCRRSPRSSCGSRWRCRGAGGAGAHQRPTTRPVHRVPVGCGVVIGLETFVFRTLIRDQFAYSVIATGGPGCHTRAVDRRRGRDCQQHEQHSKNTKHEQGNSFLQVASYAGLDTFRSAMSDARLFGKEEQALGT